MLDFPGTASRLDIPRTWGRRGQWWETQIRPPTRVVRVPYGQNKAVGPISLIEGVFFR